LLALVSDPLEEERKNDVDSWICVASSKQSADVLEVKGYGKDSDDPDGGLPYRQYMKPNTIAFVVHRVMLVPSHLQDSRNARFASPYYCVLRWQGEECPVMETALSSHHYTHFAKVVAETLGGKGVAVQPGHLRLSTPSEVTWDAIIKHWRLDTY